ncbi:hypothetical protein KSP40_PGU002848 [Platanthera guangdongensis]|uniref:Uncharacterized protein n=1 Tax=Platanthera guangdongensis TaxID=2320717 RepID=A0ABR2N385_9ASPA
MMVMMCILVTPWVFDDWNRMNIFSLHFKSGEKWCKLIIDSGVGSCGALRGGGVNKGSLNFFELFIKYETRYYV